jgi:cytochrome c2
MQTVFVRTRLAAPAGAALALAALTVAATVRLAAGQPASVMLSVDLPDRPGAGARVFEQKGCARCHAIGERGPRIGPDLGRVVFFGDVLDLAGAFWNHAPVMTQKMAALKIGRPVLASGEAADLVAFLTAYRYYDTMIREAGNPALGRGVFLRKGCAECHEAALGQTMGAPDLRKYRSRQAPILIAEAMWEHSPAMTAAMQARKVPWPTFKGREMTDLTAYLQAGFPARGPDPAVFELGNPRRGRDLFASKGCNTCHPIAGAGGQGAPDLGTRGRAMARSVPEIAGLMWNHSQQMTAEFARRGVARASFSGQEMADVISYLYFVNYANVRGTPSRGGQVFTEKCSPCHTLGRQSVGPDLLSVAGLDQPIGIIAAMWNHAAAMEQQSTRRGVRWPRLERGDTADVAAFLITRRAAKP